MRTKTEIRRCYINYLTLSPINSFHQGKNGSCYLSGYFQAGLFLHSENLPSQGEGAEKWRSVRVRRPGRQFGQLQSLNVSVQKHSYLRNTSSVPSMCQTPHNSFNNCPGCWESHMQKIDIKLCKP